MPITLRANRSRLAQASGSGHTAKPEIPALRAARDPDGCAVCVHGLRKSYGDVVAVAGLDLEIRFGEIFALLGPNGAGKTTTVEILEGYRSRDGGDVTVLGHDPGRERDLIKPRVGIVLQSTGVEPYLTVEETLAMYAQLYPHPRPVDKVLELAGLGGKRRDRVNQLSGGQQRRLDMAIALVGDPDLLFLDEPTTGFDPSSRHEAWEVVKALAEFGKTVVLTTHYMDEAQYLADRVAVVAGGKIVAEDAPSTLGFRDRAKAQIKFRLPEGLAPPARFGGRVGSDRFVEVEVDDAVSDLHDLLHWAADNGVDLEGLEVKRPSLEDVYLRLTNPVTGVGAGSSDTEAEPRRR